MIHTEKYAFNNAEIRGILEEQGLTFEPEATVTVVVLLNGVERLRLPLDDAELGVYIDPPSEAAAEVMVIPMRAQLHAG